jgi:hypothetical protein
LRGWAAQEAQSAELGVGGSFEDLEEVLALEWLEWGRILFHGVDNKG